MDSAETFLGGAWVTAPAKYPEGCHGNDEYCYRVTAAHKFGCDKGFAIKWEYDDAYGDTVATGRERVLTMAKDTPQNIEFAVYEAGAQENGADVTVSNAACI